MLIQRNTIPLSYKSYLLIRLCIVLPRTLVFIKTEEPTFSTVLIPMCIYFAITHLNIYYFCNTLLSAPSFSRDPAQILSSSFAPQKKHYTAAELRVIKPIQTHVYTTLAEQTTFRSKLDYLLMGKQKLLVFNSFTGIPSKDKKKGGEGEVGGRFIDKNSMKTVVKAKKQKQLLFIYFSVHSINLQQYFPKIQKAEYIFHVKSNTFHYTQDLSPVSRLMAILLHVFIIVVGNISQSNTWCLFCFPLCRLLNTLN